MALPVNGDSCVSLMKGTLVLPVPRYPASVVTDASLKIAANQVTTTLVTSVSSLDSIFRVSDTSRLVVDMLLTLDSEIVSVSSINSGANTINVVRGFDGTFASGHAAGRTLAAYIDAWHHNALAAEVKAIEAALGANLSNITGNNAIVSRSYAWVRQPGGSLNVGNNVITLTPVPAGVNGANAKHYVYVSGGTGAAEACLITGGTAVGGSATGTLIISCANAHSGSWSVGTATAGIQEAVHVVGNSGIPVRIPEGDSVIQATTTIPYSYCALYGYGMGLSRIIASGMTGNHDAFVFQGTGTGHFNVIKDLLIQGFDTQSGGWAISVQLQEYFRAERIQIYGWPSGVWLNGAFNSDLSQIYVMGPKDLTGIGVTVEGDTTYSALLDRVIVQGYGATKPMAGLRIRRVADVIVSNCQFIACGSGLLIDPATNGVVASVKCVSTYFDNCLTNGVTIAPAANTAVARTEFISCWFSDAKEGSGMVLSNASGAEIDGVMIEGCQFYHNAIAGLYVDGTGSGAFNGVRVNACVFAGNSATTPNTYPGALFNASDWMFTNNRSGGPTDGMGNSQQFGLTVFGAACDSYIITGNDLSGNLGGGLNDNGTGLSKVISNNLGASDVVHTVPSSGIIGLGASGAETVKITGTVTIVNIVGSWSGRGVTLIFTDAAPGGLAAGGNIARSWTAVQNQSIRLTFDGTKWY
jgi:hypothetical protein